MIKDYSELFERICMLSGKPVEEYEVFYEDWVKLCKMSDFETVLKAWEDIKVENTNYFLLKIWGNKLDILEERIKASKPEEKKSRVEKDADMRAWAKNLTNFRTKAITLKEYLGTALKTGQMKPHEFKKEEERYVRLGYDFNKPIQDRGVLKKIEK